MFPYFYLPRICVIINGTIIRSEILKNPPEELAISLHTPSKQFIKTVNFFSGHIFTTVMLPVSHHSPFQVAEILLTLKQVRFDNLYIFPVTPVGAAFKQGTWVSHDQYWQFLQAFLKDYHDVAHDSSNNPTVEIMVPSVFKAFLKLNHEYAGDLDTLSGTADIVEHSCNAFDFAGGDGLKKLTFTPSGNVTGCCIMSNIPYFHLGNVLSSPLKEILEGEKSREFQQRFNNRRNHFHCLSSPCNLKDICRGGCPVTAFLSTGDILTGDKCCPLTGIEGKN
jgi:radical SAM protein with 4Fe4S-binding SPASM domain